MRTSTQRISLRPLRTSAFSALNGNHSKLNAEDAEIRRGPQRYEFKI
jgi:hypothetical protein